MTITGAIVIFVITWWLCFFIALPVGIKGAVGDSDGTGAQDPGAPLNPQIGKKVRWATLGAVAITTALGASTYIFDFEAIFLRG
ncbi:MAG: DUF1467 family protein [Pseudomonadota bacterium]